jgi:hypothetical protein
VIAASHLPARVVRGDLPIGDEYGSPGMQPRPKPFSVPAALTASTDPKETDAMLGSLIEIFPSPFQPSFDQQNPPVED